MQAPEQIFTNNPALPAYAKEHVPLEYIVKSPRGNGKNMVTPIRRVPSRRILVLQQAETSYQRIEQALRGSEEKYRTLTDNVPVRILRSTTGRIGRLLDVKRALVRILGYRSKKELLAIDV